jgi:hypothetical protein
MFHILGLYYEGSMECKFYSILKNVTTFKIDDHTSSEEEEKPLMMTCSEVRIISIHHVLLA